MKKGHCEIWNNGITTGNKARKEGHTSYWQPMAHLCSESKMCPNQNILSGFFFAEPEEEKEEVGEKFFVISQIVTFVTLCTIR